MNTTVRGTLSLALLLASHAASAQPAPPAGAATTPAAAPASPGPSAPAPTDANDAVTPPPSAEVPATPQDGAPDAPGAASPSSASAPSTASAPSQPPTRSLSSWLEEEEARGRDAESASAAKPSRLSQTEGLVLALQLGYAAPAGSLTAFDGDDTAKIFGGQVSGWGEVGARVTPSFAIALYGGYGGGGLGSANQEACKQLECSSYTGRVGLAMRYRFFPAPHVQPWIGYAAGYEITGLRVSDGTNEATAAYSGWEFAHFSVGADYSDDERFAIGPVFDLGLGEYGHFESRSPKGHVDLDVPRPAFHEWLTIGLRVTLMP